jgi:hypothetical protein
VDPADPRIRVWRLEGAYTWIPASAAEFFGSDNPQVPTTVFIHGNEVDPTGAVRRAWRVYGRLCTDSAGRPFRLVIWSWPSERVVARRRQDAQLKAAYSDTEAFYLANVLRRMERDVPVCLIGYSFGARVITGALEILAGGQVAGRCLPLAEGVTLGVPQRRPVRAVLIAAAADACWLLPGARNGLALSQTEQMLITRNCCDPVLRFYPLLYGRGGPQAMGYVGPCWGGDVSKLEVLDVTYSVGRIHDWDCYFSDLGLNARMAHYSFLDLPLPAGE